MLKGIIRCCNDLIGILYPPLCPVCGDVLMKQETVLCLPCLMNLPLTGFHTDPENAVAQMFWGRVFVEHATAFICLYRDSRYRQILHELKYRGQYRIGTETGRMFGRSLRSTPFSQVDLVHPVPLHKRKQRTRGYNQSSMIAKGLAAALGKPFADNLIRRIISTHSQTSKNRYERWENVEGIFDVQHEDQLKDKHILLVDDVVTTGSTLEACAHALLKTENVKVSIAALAYVKKDD